MQLSAILVAGLVSTLSLATHAAPAVWTDFGSVVRLWTASSNSGSPLGVAFQVFDDGYSLSVPLALLDADRALDFAGLSTVRVGPEATIGLLDFTAVGGGRCRGA